MSYKIKIGIIGGSGLDDPDILSNRQEKNVVTPFGKPSDSLILGTITGVPCVLLARHGRKHTIMPGNVNFRANIWALKEEGCTHIIASIASGSLREEIQPGDLVLVDDFIDRTKSRKDTFYDGGENHPSGVCHMPTHPPFCQKLRQTLASVADKLQIHLHPKGTVVVIEGPRFSSRAESAMHRQWGAHLVNMTLVPEVCLAKEAGISYAALAMATDYDCWRDTGDSVTQELAIQMFTQNVDKIIRILLNAIPVIVKEDWSKTIQEAKDIVTRSIMGKY